MERNGEQIARRYIASRRAHPDWSLVADVSFGVAVAAFVWVTLGETTSLVFVVVYLASLIIALIARTARRRPGMQWSGPPGPRYGRGPFSVTQGGPTADKRQRGWRNGLRRHVPSRFACSAHLNVVLPGDVPANQAAPEGAAAPAIGWATALRVHRIVELGDEAPFHGSVIALLHGAKDSAATRSRERRGRDSG